MNIKEEMEELAREFEDALVFNKPILPVLHKAHLSKTEIHFMSIDRFLMRVNLVRTTKLGVITIDFAFDPETLQTSIFYPKGTAIEGNANAEFSNSFDVVAPGAFKNKAEVPLRWGIGGEVIGSAVVDPDGSMTAIIFPEAHDAD